MVHIYQCPLFTFFLYTSSLKSSIIVFTCKQLEEKDQQEESVLINPEVYVAVSEQELENEEVDDGRGVMTMKRPIQSSVVSEEEKNAANLQQLLTMQQNIQQQLEQMQKMIQTQVLKSATKSVEVNTAQQSQRSLQSLLDTPVPTINTTCNKPQYNQEELLNSSMMWML